MNPSLPPKVKKKLLRELSIESEVRGQDATGIAYPEDEGLHIFKIGKPAHRVRLYVPGKARVVMGHTRASTLGSPKFNENNHPFYGKAGNDEFCLAHNGIIYNHRFLKTKYELPSSPIETDSYVAVQLLNRNDRLDMQALKEMSEAVDASFNFTVLVGNGDLYFVKGDCPLTIAFFEEIGLYVYASTSSILCRALMKTGLDGLTPTLIDLKCGQIMRIGSMGDTEYGTFETINDRSWIPLASLCRSYYTGPDLSELIELAGVAGVSEDDIRALYRLGFEFYEIEELIEEPELLREQLMQSHAQYDPRFHGEFYE